MEEASVAGESPDRSKQRESSAEPTSGSAGPVPEARSEAADPRLSVARASVDTATRVLSAKDLAKAREGAADGAGEEAGEGADEKGDEDLRAAVAAWVRSADEAESDSDSESDEAESSKEPEKTDATDATGETGETEEAEDEPEAAAEADARAEGDAEGEDATEPEDAAEEGGDAAGDTGAKAAAVSDKADAESDASAAEDEGREGDDAAKAAAGGDASADEARDTDSDAEDREGADADAKAAVSDEAGAEDAKADTDAEDSDVKGGEAGADSEKGSAEETPKGAEKAEGGADEPPVDQPTTVFKAVRPSKPAVDQPTTMLKLGDAAKAKPAEESKESEKAKEPAKDSESEKDAERTSKFVALKPLDEPAARKPRPAAPAKPAEPAEPAERTKPAEPAGPPAPADVTAAVPQIGPERTTQQPLPPKPPLDLLAELTNTPPPPQTPLRTAVRRVKIWTPLVLLLVVVFAVVQSFRPLPAPTLELTAQDSYTFDGSKIDIPWPENGQAALDVQGIGTFGSSGEQKPVPIASVAKVMTAYIILRDHPLKSGEEGPMIKIDQAAEDQSQAGQESTVNVFAGDQISEREALEGILIASANNVARLLARWDAGSEKDFVAKMNATAKDLGMTNTTYTDPSGLNDTTVSTAVDQVKLAKAAMTQPAFREVAAMMSYDDYKGVNHPNWNQLVGSNGVVGIKTGTTTSALGNLVFAAKKEVGGETHTIVGAVVRQPAGGADNTILGAALHQSDLLIRAPWSRRRS
jgi:hypothetical protein